MKKVFYSVILFVFIALFAEILLGYAIFQRLNQIYQSNFTSSIYKVVKYIPYLVDTKFGVYPVNYTHWSQRQKEPEVMVDFNEEYDLNLGENIFLTRPVTLPGFKFIPLLDYTNGHGRFWSPKDHGSDYFGFRNDYDYNVTDPNNKFRIVMTGGSECHGYSHKQPTAYLLEKELRKHYSTENIKVINLCMGGNTLPHEMQNFLHLGWPIKPHLVISHTGFNDAFEFPLVPVKFGEIGMNYWYYLEGWIDLLYETKQRSNFIKELARVGGSHDGLIRNKDTEMFRKVMKINYNKYHSIVKASGSDFLLGIQPYNIFPHERPLEGEKYRKIGYAMLDVLIEEANKLDFDVIDFTKNNTDYEFINDAMHTTQKSAKLLANQYFSFIVKKYDDKIKKNLSKE